MEENSSRFADLEKFPPLKYEKKALARSLCCPCLLLGQIQTKRKQERPGLCGLGKTGKRSCVSTCCCPLLLPCCVLRQRQYFMATYGIRGFCTESLSFCCCAYALLEHSTLLTYVRNKNIERYPWERASFWSLEKDRDLPTSFEIIVLGASGAGVSSLVHAAVGARPPLNSSYTNRKVFKPPRKVTLGSRIVPQTKDFPTTALNLWDIPANADLEPPIDFIHTAHAVVAVFDTDRRQSLEESLQRYDGFFSDCKNPPKVRILLGNVHRDRSRDDTCEFIHEALQAAHDRDMEAVFLALHTHSAQGTKRLLERIVKHIWHSTSSLPIKPENSSGLQEQNSGEKESHWSDHSADSLLEEVPLESHHQIEDLRSPAPFTMQRN